MPLNATVHYGQNYDNAFWNGRQMVFGDGDGQLFNRFTIALDVIGHELAHGVTEDEAGLVYMCQPGALNEHLSDAFGVMIKQRVLNQTAAEADWLIGAGLLAPGVNGVALRSMSRPAPPTTIRCSARTRSRAHMDDFVTHLAGQWRRAHQFGHPEPRLPFGGVALGGHAWEKAGPDLVRDAARQPAHHRAELRGVRAPDRPM